MSLHRYILSSLCKSEILKKENAEAHKKLSEHVFTKSEDLEKGALKNALIAGTMAAASVLPQSAAPSEHHGPKFTPDRMLNAISMVESSGGKNTHHHPTPQGTAYGKWALMPSVIHDTIRLNPDLKNQYGKALRLQGQHLTHFMHDNPQLEQEIASKHLQRLEHHFGQNPDAIAFSWNQGITGTNKALKEKHNIAQHPYVQKFNQYYSSKE